MENKRYELVTSNNMKYVAGINRKNKINDMYELTIWESRNLSVLSTFFVYFDIGGERLAISDDGKYVATAQYEDYEAGNIYVYKVESGETILVNSSLRRIQWLMFESCEGLMIGTEEDGIFIFDIISNECKGKIKGEKYFYNRFGENILLFARQNIQYNERVFKSSTFTYLSSTGTPRGILVSEVNGNLFYYGDDGQLRWKSDCSDLGHFIAIYYSEKEDLVFGISLNPRKKGNERMHLVIFCGESGEVRVVKAIETDNYVFVQGEKTVMLMSGSGKRDYLA